jgi:hypothetical protein
MTLSPEQKQTVAAWVAAGDNLSAVQKKLFEQFKISLTYMDVRFLVDDLDLSLRDAAPKASADLSKAAAEGAASRSERGGAEKKGFFDKAKEKLGLAREPDAADADEAGDGPAPAGAVSVTVDAVTLLPGAMASGTVTFGDGVTGKWMVDNYGRPGFTEISRPGYRPSPADAQAFMQELNLALQNRGL